MRNTIIKPVLVAAIALASVSPAFADPLYGSNSALNGLRQQNDMAAKAYFKFSLGGKRLTPKERFRSGLKLQMRNVFQSESLQNTRFVYEDRNNLNLLDLSMTGKGLSSLQLNGVPLSKSAYTLNAGEDGGSSGSSTMRTGLIVAGGVILAIGVAAAASGGGNDSNNNNDRDGTNDNN
ncbi:MAG: hypothetical protein COA84_00525 [Robiginitomaculum sp.]|nr:MAG: hypothetical protein COA84_00525 [Robiginitomaculum sp.]